MRWHQKTPFGEIEIFVMKHTGFWFIN